MIARMAPLTTTVMAPHDLTMAPTLSPRSVYSTPGTSLSGGTYSRASGGTVRSKSIITIIGLPDGK